ncbi:hypothetical protein Ancab_024730 [Ancistrocladus abbreviatus]
MLLVESNTDELGTMRLSLRHLGGKVVLISPIGKEKIEELVEGANEYLSKWFKSFMEDSLIGKGELQIKNLAPTDQSLKGEKSVIGPGTATQLLVLGACAEHNDSTGQGCVAFQGSKSTDGSHINYKDSPPKAVDFLAPIAKTFVPSEVSSRPRETGRVLGNVGSPIESLSNSISTHSPKASGLEPSPHVLRDVLGHHNS